MQHPQVRHSSSNALAVVVFLATVAYLPGTLSATTAGRWSALAVGAAALLFWVRRPLLGRSHAWGAAALIWAGLSILWSVSWPDTLGELLRWVVLAALFLAASQCLDPSRAARASALGISLSFPFVLVQIYGGHPVIATDVPAGLFLSRNAMGEVAACAFVWVVAREIWFLAPPLLALAVLSDSRGAALGVGAGLVVLYWRKAPVVVALVVVAMILCIAAMTASKDASLSSVNLRLDIWEFAVVNLSLRGFGLDTFGTLAPGFGYVHNDYLQLAFELGAGSLLVVPIFWRAIRSGTPEAAALGSILASASVSFPSHHPTGAMLVAVLSGLAIGFDDRRQRAEHLLRVVGLYGRFVRSPARASGHVRHFGLGGATVAVGQEHPLGAGNLAPRLRADEKGTFA